MENYKPNSNRFKEEQKNKEYEKRVEKPVVTGRVTKKQNTLRKLSGEFISEDARNVKSYVFGEVLIPAIKKAISDIVTDGIDIILYGESKRGNRRSTADKVSYRNYYDRDNAGSARGGSSVGSRYSYDDIVLNTRGEAEDVLDRMFELMDSYGLVRVADLYDLVGITGSFTDNKYGWTNLKDACVIRARDGYMIKLPRAIPID